MNDAQKDVAALIQDYFRRGDYQGWFEEVYARADRGQGLIPWAYRAPAPLLTIWAERAKLSGAGRTALVVGCGLGDDAEYLSQLGFHVTAFDIARTAIRLCNERFLFSRVDYFEANLLDVMPNWRAAYDFVLEHRTIQSLPWHFAEPAIESIASFVAPGGTLLVICHGREPEQERRGIPWPLSRNELDQFLAQGLEEKCFEDFVASDSERRTFRVEYQRPR